MKKYILATLITVMTLSLFVLPVAVGAQYGLESNFATDAGLGEEALESVVSGVISTILGVLGIIAVVLILYGGFIWMTAAGNEDKVDKAKKLIVSGIIGLVIILSAYAIATFVLSSINGATHTS